MPVKTTVFDKQNDIKQYSISNPKETLVVKVIDYGAIITNILFKDKNRVERDVVLGYDDFKGYQRKDNPYFGALVGRVANRIANGKFILNDTIYELDKNDIITSQAGNGNTLHGGLKGFDKNKWTLKGTTDNSVSLELISPDGDQHFPGSVRVGITYTVGADNELKLEYSAQLLANTLKDTIINLSNHSYFNLNGCADSAGIQVLNHKVRMSCDHYLDVDKTLIPNGFVVPTKVSPVMDFSGKDLITLSDRIPKLIDGFDHCFVIDTNVANYGITGGKALNDAVVVTSPLTGITLTFSTTEPGVQFYTGIHLNDTFTTKKTQTVKALKLAKYSGICLEGQRFPDAIHQEKWQKQVILSPNQKYQQKSVFKFSIN